jgi:hypothetical protein
MTGLKFVLNSPAFVVGLFFSIPILGRITGLIWRGIILDLFWRIISLPDVILGLFGVLPEKKLRVAVIILANEAQMPIVKMDRLKQSIQETIEVYKQAANVRVIVEKIHEMETAAPAANLNPSCSSRAVIDDIWSAGTYFENTANIQCFDSTFQRIIGFAAPVIVFIVEEVKGGDIGCSLGPFTDYVTLEGGKPKCMAHEIAHACGLWHVKAKDNLANHFCNRGKLEPRQVAIVRSSRHVTYI